MKLPVWTAGVIGVPLRTPLFRFVSTTPKKKPLVPWNFPFRTALIAILNQELLQRSVKLKVVFGVLQPLPMFPGASTLPMVHMATPWKMYLKKQLKDGGIHLPELLITTSTIGTFWCSLMGLFDTHTTPEISSYFYWLYPENSEPSWWIKKPKRHHGFLSPNCFLLWNHCQTPLFKSGLCLSFLFLNQLCVPCQIARNTHYFMGWNDICTIMQIS